MAALQKLILLIWLVVLPMSVAQTASEAAARQKALLKALPHCAVPCLEYGLSQSKCSPTNTTCTCTDHDLNFYVTACVTHLCTPKEALTTKNLTMTNCGAPIRDQSGRHLLLCNTLSFICIGCIIHRLGFKFWWGIRLGSDDFFLFLVGLAGIPSLVVNAYGVVPNGLGRDIWTISFDNITSFAKWFYMLEMLYFVQIALLKMTILLLYLRIFPTKGVRRVLWCTILFNILFGVGYICVSALQCQPISYFWTKWDGEHQGTCLDISMITLSHAIINIVSDLCMLAIPLSQLRNLHLDWKKKLGVGLMFSVGGFVTVISVLRIRFIQNYGNSANVTWDYTEVSDWCYIEICAGIICACMPAIRQFLTLTFPKAMITTKSLYGTGQSAPSRPSQRRNGERSHNTVVSSVTNFSYRLSIDRRTSERAHSNINGDSDEMELVQKTGSNTDRCDTTHTQLMQNK